MWWTAAIAGPRIPGRCASTIALTTTTTCTPASARTTGWSVRPSTAFEGDRDELTNLVPTHFVLQYQRIFTPTFVNEIKAGVNREPMNRTSLGPFKNETINISGFTSLNDNNVAIEAGTSYSLIDNVAISRGRHSLKFGGEIRRIHVNVGDPLFAS